MIVVDSLFLAKRIEVLSTSKPIQLSPSSRKHVSVVLVNRTAEYTFAEMQHQRILTSQKRVLVKCKAE